MSASNGLQFKVPGVFIYLDALNQVNYDNSN